MSAVRRPWSPEDLQYLRDNAGKFTSEYISLRLKRTAGAVRAKARDEGVKFTEYDRWTPEETKFLEDNCETMTPTQIGKAIGRPAMAVRSKAAYIGITFGPWKKISDHDVALCKALFRDGVSVEEIAKKMEIEFGTVRSYVYGWRRKNVTALQG